jgi:hypothetical protein
MEPFFGVQLHLSLSASEWPNLSQSITIVISTLEDESVNGITVG